MKILHAGARRAAAAAAPARPTLACALLPRPSMTMEHTWVVGLDLSERARGALIVAAWLTRAGDSAVGVHILESWARPHVRPDAVSTVHEMVVRMTRELHLPPLARVSVREAVRAEDGLTAAAGDATGIVIGRAAASLQRPLIRLGVVARQLLRQLPRPVIVAPPDLESVAPGPILLATDLGPASERAAGFARRLAAAQGRPLAVVHVAAARDSELIDRRDPTWLAADEDYQAEAATALAEWSAAHGLGGAAQHLVHGDAPARVAAVAADLQAAMVVVGSRRLGPIARAFVSSTASTLAGLAAAPVAVIPCATQDAPPDLVGAAERLASDHTRFARRFQDLCDRADSGDWRELDVVWRDFSEDIERHLDFEERQVFPRLAAEGQGCRALTDGLLAQHVEIRAMLDALGLQIQLKEIRAATIHAFTALLHDHAAAENLRVYPSLAERASATP